MHVYGSGENIRKEGGRKLNRNAIDTIKGYFYQFDYTIKKLLELNEDNETVVIERIEDVDIKTAIDETAVQCKYYSKTEYNHSIIAKPIRLMLSHFMRLKQSGLRPVNYMLYGYYNGGQDKLTLPLPLIDLKYNFLTYTKEKTKHYHHSELGATDNELKEFISLLTIDINAQEYEIQLNNIFTRLKKEFICSDFEAEHYFYNNALKVIKQMSVEADVSRRTISKKDFLFQINTKSILFNQWFIEYKGLKNYFKELKKEFFTNLNSSPFDRFFLIEIDKGKYSRSELKEVIFLVSEKWSKLSRREPNPFCPFIFIYGIDENELSKLKAELTSENFSFIDGYDFYGATFNVKSIHRQPNYSNGIAIKFINKLELLNTIISESSLTKEIYQFYLKSPFYSNDLKSLKHVKIQIRELKNIKEVI